MGYREENYIIDPEVEDEREPIVEKPMESVSIPSNRIKKEYEIIDEPPQPAESVLDEIHKAALEEGLVDEEEEYVGGKGASPDDVIDALVHKERSSGAKKNQEEYEESKMKKNRKIMATRELLFGMTKKIINITVSAVVDIQGPDGTVTPELCDLNLKVRRLTESQFNHLVNRRIASKKVSDMSEEEYQEDSHFRSNYLAETVIDPQLTPEEWYYDIPNSLSAEVFAKVQEVTNNFNDVELFQ